jgi:DNA-binding NtrC family response regulator
MVEAIEKGNFREDLFYRLSTIDINLPPLRERSEDIHLLFRKFASDFAQKYKMPTLRLDQSAVDLLLKYRWSGNIRQLRNVAEQISVLEQQREINAATLSQYLPNMSSNLPAVISTKKAEGDFSNEREILYKVLFDMQRDVNDLKKLTMELMKTGNANKVQEENSSLIKKIYSQEQNNEAVLAAIVEEEPNDNPMSNKVEVLDMPNSDAELRKGNYDFVEDVKEEESLSLQEKELELIKKSLEKYDGKRKDAADELGISERTLYRKIKQYDL